MFKGNEKNGNYLFKQFFHLQSIMSYTYKISYLTHCKTFNNEKLKRKQSKTRRIVLHVHCSCSFNQIFFSHNIQIGYYLNGSILFLINFGIFSRCLLFIYIETVIIGYFLRLSHFWLVAKCQPFFVSSSDNQNAMKHCGILYANGNTSKRYQFVGDQNGLDLWFTNTNFE